MKMRLIRIIISFLLVIISFLIEFNNDFYNDILFFIAYIVVGYDIARYFGSSNMKVLNYGSFKEFSDREPIDKLYTKYRLTKELITKDIEKLL